MSLLNVLPIIGHGIYGSGPKIDADGNVREPGFWENALAPDVASQEMELRNQQAIAQKKLQTQRAITGSEVDTQPWENNPNLGRFGQPQANVDKSVGSQLGTDGLYASMIPKGQPADYHEFSSGSPTIANVNNMNLAGKERSAWIDQTINPDLSPLHLAPNAVASGQLGTGLLPRTGALEARAANTTAETGLGEAKFKQSMQPREFEIAKQDQINRLAQVTSLHPLDIAHSINVLRGQLGRDPTDQETQDYVAQTQHMAAMFGLNEQPLRQSTQRLQDIAENYNAGIIPTRGTNIPFGSRVSTTGVTDVPGVLPAYANMYRMINAKAGTGLDGVKSPSGYSTDLPPPEIKAGAYTPGSGTTTSDDDGKTKTHPDAVVGNKDIDALVQAAKDELKANNGKPTPRYAVIAQQLEKAHTAHKLQEQLNQARRPARGTLWDKYMNTFGSVLNDDNTLNTTSANRLVPATPFVAAGEAEAAIEPYVKKAWNSAVKRPLSSVYNYLTNE